jgi:hypothetical protein
MLATKSLYILDHFVYDQVTNSMELSTTREATRC